MRKIAKPNILQLNTYIKKNKNENIYDGYACDLHVKDVNKDELRDVNFFIEESCLDKKNPVIFIENECDLEHLFFLIALTERKNRLIFVTNTLSEAKYIRTLFKGLIFTKELPKSNDYYDYKLFKINLAISFTEKEEDNKINEYKKNGFKLMIYDANRSNFKNIDFSIDFVVIILK